MGIQFYFKMCKKLRVFQKFRNSIQEAVNGLRNARPTNLHYRIQNYILPGEEKFFITEERLKCCQADRLVNWFVWDWMMVEEDVDSRLVTSKLKGERMKLPKRNPCSFPKGSKNCPLAHYSYYVISSLLLSTIVFTNTAVSSWSWVDPLEFLLQIHSMSGNQWGLLDRGFQLFPVERILLADAKMS